MWKFPKAAALVAAAAVVSAAAPARADGDVAKGARLFKRCVVCHAIGPNAKNKIGPELNGLIGRKAATAPGYRYSQGMKTTGQNNVVWSEKTLDAFLKNPRAFVKGTKMAFPGLKKEKDRADLIAYLQSLSKAAAKPAASGGAKEQKAAQAPAPKPAPRQLATTAPIPKHGVFHLGRVATPGEIKAWDIDVRPDGTGLPEGKGTVAQGETIYTDRCAACHGDFGEGRDRWPVLAGGMDTLKADRPVKTIGSYWPYLPTVFDYVRRAMPFGDARSLSNNDVYALTAYLLYLNDIVQDTNFELSAKNFTKIHLPNEANFIADNRAAEPEYAKKGEPCMSNCKPEPAKVIMRARVLDVTPQSGQAKKKPHSSIE